MKLKILSWNIWIDCNFDQVKDFLGNCTADIIGLQEVKDNDYERDIINYLVGLGYHHVFVPVRKVWAEQEYKDGLAIFSRYKIVASTIYNLSEENNRCALTADIDVNGKIIHVFSTHLVHDHQQNSEIQQQQAKNLIKILPNENTILMGDFNALPKSDVIKKISKILIDTDPESLPTWSLDPKGCSVCGIGKVDTRLDYIFVSKEMKASSFVVENSKGSDHLAISSEIEL